MHPAQVPVIRHAFALTDGEIDWAREVLAALGSSGVARLADGSKVDEAMRRRAERILRP